MKTSFGRLTALIGLIVLSTPVQGQDYDYLTYGGTVTITRYMGQATEVVVPSKINGVPVAAISDNAFQNCATLSSVAVSENIKSIGRHAFAGCTNLKAITFYDGLTGIGDAAFSGCVSLTNLVLPNSVTSLGMAAFQGCTSLIRVNIPDRCRNLELAGYAHYKSPFSGCTNLQAIDAGPGNLAYSSREGVLFNKEQSRLIMCPEGKTGAYMVPNGIRSIWSQAFTGCGSLTSIAIPESVTNIECGDWYKKWYAPNFSGCGSLSSFEVNPANPVYSSREGVLFDKSHGALLRCPTGRTGTYVVPEDIKSIGSGASIFAFAGCAKLTAITIPESVANITPFAFLDCSSLSIAPMPTNLTCIEHFVFAGCSNLVGASIPVRVTRIGGYAFSGCSSLTNMIIPGNVTEIGEYAFSACRGLTSVAIPGSVTNLWFAAFYQCIG